MRIHPVGSRLLPVLLVLATAAAALAEPAHGQGLPPAPPAPGAQDVVGPDAGMTVTCAPLPCRACCAPTSRFALSLPVWVPGVTGSLATGGQEASSDGSFFDRFVLVKESTSELRFAFVGRVEGLYKRWWLLADLYGATIGNEIDWTIGSNVTDVEVNALIGRAVVGYEAWRLPTGTGRGSCVTLTPYLGVRTYHVELRINAAEATDDWWDLIGGLEARWWISPRWNLRLLADIGAGVDKGSELSWSAALEVHYRLASWFELFLGYGVLDVEYDRRSGNRFLLDIVLAGPQVGFTIDF